MIKQLPVQPPSREPVSGLRALWSALDAAATPAFTLATLAVLVRAIGPGDYGLLVIALAVSGLSMAINPAIAVTTTKFVSEQSITRDSSNRSVAAVITLSLIVVGVIDLGLLLGTAIFNESLSSWVFGAAIASIRPVGRVLLLAVLAVGIQADRSRAGGGH